MSRIPDTPSRVHGTPGPAGWELTSVSVPPAQVNQRNVPGIDSAYLAMDTEEGVEVVWNEVQFSERKNFKLQEVSWCVSQQDVGTHLAPGWDYGCWWPFMWIIGWIWSAVLLECSKCSLSLAGAENVAENCCATSVGSCVGLVLVMKPHSAEVQYRMKSDAVCS